MIWLSLVSYCFWYVLFYSILQSLRCAANVLIITATHVLIDDHTLLFGKHSIFADRCKHLSYGKYNTKFYCPKAWVDCSFALLFKNLIWEFKFLFPNYFNFNLINSEIRKKIEEFKLRPKEGSKKFPVYLKLPRIGNISTKFEIC